MKENKGHPPALYVLFFTEMWERFSYYGMRNILILYITASIANGGMGFSDEEGGPIYGIYTASVYLLTLPGGWIADNLLGQRKAIWFGGITIMLGHIILAIPATNTIFFLGLATVAIGTGLLKANISSIVGELYPEGGVRRDAGFSIFYMGINLGGFLGSIIVGYLAQEKGWGWHWGFGAAAVGMFLGMLGFKLLENKYLKPYGLLKPKEKLQKSEIIREGTYKGNHIALAMVSILVLALIILQFIGYIDLTTANGIAKAMTFIILSVTAFYFIYIYVAGNLTSEERTRMYVLAIFFLAVAIFWGGYEQGGSTLNLFAARYTNLNVFGWKMPSTWLQSLQSVYVIILAPIAAFVWLYLSKRKSNPYAPVKFGLGLVVLSLGFFIMYFAAQYVAMGEKVSYWWLVVSYLFTVIGELCISPVGLSFYTKLAPPRFVSQLMGIWFVGAALGNLISGLIAGSVNKEAVNQLPNLFILVTAVSITSGLVMLLFYKPIKKWMAGVE